MKFLRFALLVFCVTGSDSSEDAAAAPHVTFRDHVRSASRLLAPAREERQTLTVREFARSLAGTCPRRASRNTHPHPKSTVADIESTLNQMFDHDELLEISYQEGGGIAVRNPWMHMWLPDMAEASIIIAFLLTSSFEIGNAIARKIFYIIATLIFNAATTKEIFPILLYFTACFYTHWYNLMAKLSPDARDFLFSDRWWGLAIENGMEEVLKLLMLAVGAWGTHISHDKLALFAGLGFATFESLNYVETHLHTVDAMAHRLITFFIHPAFTSLAMKYKGLGFLMAWTFHFWYDSIACNFVPQINDIIPTDAAMFLLALLLKKGIMQLQ